MPIVFAALTMAVLCAACDADRRPARALSEDSVADTAAPRAAADTSATHVVTVYFTRDETAVPIERRVPATGSRLDAVIAALLAGPTAAEQDAGIHSWFSAATAGTLRSVHVDAAGLATVDFTDFSGMIPNASSSTGSTLLLAELNGTIFGEPQVTAIEYRFDGSCAAFWNWLQYGCQIVRRAS